ncbi:hypothetical protein AVEN_150407-1 [Araneus ventricosus]|uniref:Mutator-like transposase domain-containing protein n=1 Tax=Araneus ventricosus TaxID=182803 RepID=A0A4Y2QZN5_ARAVE|nr:hypothetical protein AVEN_150407-1 [Araneus ventricosus]
MKVEKRYFRGSSRQTLFHIPYARYTKYFNDGDSKAFDAITEENIYGVEFQVEKLECIDHVMKHIGSRLRRLKDKMQVQLLSDGKRLSGKKPICYHAMCQAIWAIFMHKFSTDEHTKLRFCPIGEDSWCGFH